MKTFLETIIKLDDKFDTSPKEEIIVEGITDIPRKTYAKGVFDDYDTDNPKLKTGVIAMIKKQISQFEKYAPVKSYSLIGSILTKRYRNDADLDINVLFDVPPADRVSMREAISKNLKDINGRLIPGTKHPINYFVITDPELKKKNDSLADGVYDIMNNDFVRKPKEQSFDPKKYEADFHKKVKEIDVVKGELQRDIIDYKELQELEPSDIENLQSLVVKKLTEIESAIDFFDKLGQDLIQTRRDLYSKDLTPDEIRQYGVHHKLPKNVIYKYLEKYHYLKFFKKCKEIRDDGKITDDEIDSISEATEKSVAFTFGRFNPPTIGHEKLIKKVKSVPANDYRIYLSKSVDTKKNPLSPRVKLDYMKKIFPQHSNKIMLNPTNMVLDIATDLYKKGFTNITMVAGSDRIREFETLLKKYNDVNSRHGYYNFNKIKVVSAGERDPDADGAMGMSASKMRDAATKGDIKSFKTGLPTSYRDVEKLFKDVRKGMNLTASYEGQIMGYQYKPIASMEEFEQNQIRDLYVREVIFNIGDKINNVNLNTEGTVVRRGTNYIVMEDSESNLHKAWIWDCVPVTKDKEAIVREYNLDVDYGFSAVSDIEEDKKSGGHTRKLPQDKSIGSKKGTQPKKYYKGLSKNVKSKRDAHFKNQDTTKGPYKPAPGDDTAKTKPSKHTQKFKKMFGELKINLADACWKGFKQVGMKKKNGKQVPNCVPEVYEIGKAYADHTKEVTPGQSVEVKKVKGIIDKETTKVTQKDIKEWSLSDAVIHKYRDRYKEQWREKLDEVVDKMIKKLELDNNA